jgi:citrate lyase subunit beta/citryl-CoA lyase
MAASVRPRRSALYMPGSNARALEKARSLEADVVIMDLEDAVSPDKKEAAREAIGAALAEGGYGDRELVIRTNGLEGPWGAEDLAFAAKAGADADLLPKVVHAEQIWQAEEPLSAAGAPDSLTIWSMLETPLGMLHAEEIAAASPRLGCLVLGTSDLAKDLHALHTRDRLPFVTSLGLCVLAARAYGLAVLDGVHLDLDDAEGFEASCRQGLELGFDGKTLIHPKTLAAANRIFAPSGEEIAWSRKIIDAHAAAEAEGSGVVLVNGKLVEALHVENARRIIALAEMIEFRESNN